MDFALTGGLLAPHLGPDLRGPIRVTPPWESIIKKWILCCRTIFLTASTTSSLFFPLADPPFPSCRLLTILTPRDSLVVVAAALRRPSHLLLPKLPPALQTNITQQPLLRIFLTTSVTASYTTQTSQNTNRFVDKHNGMHATLRFIEFHH